MNGIEVISLKPGTKITVKTLNSVYDMEVTEEPGELLVQGGTHITEKKKIYFSGSTWGGTSIRVGWIGYNMHMEMITGKWRKLTTSPVQEITVSGDGWSYKLEDLEEADCPFG